MSSRWVMTQVPISSWAAFPSSVLSMLPGETVICAMSSAEKIW